MKKPSLALIGFMGTGKTTVGRLCASRLAYKFQDSDACIVRRAGMSIRRIFAERGEPAFRQWEREVIADLTASDGLVIATGGGAVLDPGNAAALAAGCRVVLLTASVDHILGRVGAGHSRPLLAGVEDPRGHIESMLAQRMPVYRQAAHHVVDTTETPPARIAEEIAAWYHSCIECE